MSIEHFYWFVDLSAVDPILQMSWETFLRNYPWRQQSLEKFLLFAVETEPNRVTINQILRGRTIRWTMRRATPAYYFLNEIVHHVPGLKSQCPEIWVSKDLDSEIAVLLASAVEAFLRSQISQRTLWAVYNLNGADDPQAWLQLSRSECKKVKNALGCGAVEKPIFRWQKHECLVEDYRTLGLADTKRFTNFLLRAWKENWTVPRLKDDIKKELKLSSESNFYFRNFELTKHLVNSFNATHLVKPCLLRYFG